MTPGELQQLSLAIAEGIRSGFTEARIDAAEHDAGGRSLVQELEIALRPHTALVAAFLEQLRPDAHPDSDVAERARYWLVHLDKGEIV